MLLDGAKIDELGALIYMTDSAVDASPLYVGTPLASILPVSPWLLTVKDFDTYRLLLEKAQPNGAGLVIESSACLAELVKFWKMRLFTLLDGQEALFRLYEPSVLSALLMESSPFERAQLMGPNDVIWYWDEKRKGWQHEVNDTKQAASLIDKFALTSSHLAALTAQKKIKYEEQVYTHINRYFPGVITDKEQGHVLAKRLIDKSVSLGFSTGQSLFYFVNIWVALGADCLDNDMHPEISRLLTQPSQLSHAARIERAALLARQVKT
ncbi:DUF4123 domain-containing protein [Shewanella sp. MMG014]|uniref:DUF4123 domain-containing protein n=1 Tax=Shewanella sp. MMG014 TaxID=2822691 RepID=UPI002493EB24|nr:DUF4123 domain-containing protein [Shewanella sp. MMG014]